MHRAFCRPPSRVLHEPIQMCRLRNQEHLPFSGRAPEPCAVSRGKVMVPVLALCLAQTEDVYAVLLSVLMDKFLFDIKDVYVAATNTHVIFRLQLFDLLRQHMFERCERVVRSFKRSMLNCMSPVRHGRHVLFSILKRVMWSDGVSCVPREYAVVWAVELPTLVSSALDPSHIQRLEWDAMLFTCRPQVRISTKINCAKHFDYVQNSLLGAFKSSSFDCGLLH